MTSTSTAHAFETGHEEMIHDAQMDFYGNRLATASSDRTIKIFEVIRATHNHVADLKGHDGPVWQVAWAHPKFGSLLASCGYDKRVIVWKEETPNKWVKVFENQTAEASVNSVAWAPHSFGLELAVACADGSVSIYTYRDNQQWEQNRFLAHPGGVNSVSWGPDVVTGALLGAQHAGQVESAPVKRFVTAGCDNKIKIWAFNEVANRWTEQNCFVDNNNSHDDWVRDAAWAPSLGLPFSTIASASEDKSVIIWTETQTGMWRKSHQIRFNDKVWKVSWSTMGNVLAVSQGDNAVSLWKESSDGVWANLETLADPQASTQDTSS